MQVVRHAGKACIYRPRCGPPVGTTGVCLPSTAYANIGDLGFHPHRERLARRFWLAIGSFPSRPLSPIKLPLCIPLPQSQSWEMCFPLGLADARKQGLLSPVTTLEWLGSPLARALRSTPPRRSTRARKLSGPSDWDFFFSGANHIDGDQNSLLALP